MGSKEKWVSGQKGPLTNSLQILCQDRSALLHCACKATIYQEQCAQGWEIYDRGRNRRRSQLRSGQLCGIHRTHKIFTISVLLTRASAEQKKNVLVLGMGKISQIQAGIHTKATPYIKCVPQIFLVMPKIAFHLYVTSYIHFKTNAYC